MKLGRLVTVRVTHGLSGKDQQEKGSSCHVYQQCATGNGTLQVHRQAALCRPGCSPAGGSSNSWRLQQQRWQGRGLANCRRMGLKVVCTAHKRLRGGKSGMRLYVLVSLSCTWLGVASLLGATANQSARSIAWATVSEGMQAC